MRLPPNAKQIFDMRKRGQVPVPGPFGHVSIVPDWRFEVVGAYVVAPPEIPAAELDFRFCAGLDVTIFCLIGTLGRMVDDRLDQLTLSVMNGRPRTIAVVDLRRARAGLGASLAALFLQVAKHA